MTKYHKLGGLNKSLFYHRRLKSKIKVSAGLVSAETTFLILQMVVFLLCLHMVFCWSVHVSVLISFSYKDMSYIGLQPTHMTLFYPNHVFKGPISEYSHVVSTGVGTSVPKGE